MSELEVMAAALAYLRSKGITPPPCGYNELVEMAFAVAESNASAEPTA
jgi:hypothetical protein